MNIKVLDRVTPDVARKRGMFALAADLSANGVTENILVEGVAGADRYLASLNVSGKSLHLVYGNRRVANEYAAAWERDQDRHAVESRIVGGMLLAAGN